MKGDLIDGIMAVCIMGLIFALVKYAGSLIELLMKKLRSKRYPIKCAQMPISRLSTDDIVTLDDIGACEYHGFYNGYHLFAPKERNLENDESYVRLHAKDASPLISKVTNRRIGLKFERCNPEIADGK